MDNYFDKNFIYIDNRYVNMNHIVRIKGNPETNTVFISLTNGEMLCMNGTLNQLIEKMGAYDTFKDEEEKYVLETLIFPGRVAPADDNPNVVKCEYDPVKDRTVVVRRKEKLEKYEVDRQEQYDIMRNCTVVRIKYSDGTYEDIVKD